MLAELCSYNPRHLVLADVMSGDIETFVTLQEFYGRKIRFRFLNIEELLNETKKHGFALIYKSNYAGKICDAIRSLDRAHFDKKFQLDFACQLVFSRDG